MADRLNSILYLYGITDRPERLPVTTRGVDGTSTVEALECSVFTCWISWVDASEFGDNLPRNMENLEWLADASVRHQRVVGAIHERVPILPARFGTIFLNESSLRDDVTRRKAALQAGFQRTANADEWGIRVFTQSRSASVTTQARTGKEYLQKKSALLQAKPSRTLEAEIQRFAEEVAELATASAEGGKVGSGQAGLRWQRSVLVPRARRSKFEALLARFARKFEDRFRVECTGPWPPYSFVADEAQSSPSQKRRSPGAREVAR
jgi:hypothetical protein